MIKLKPYTFNNLNENTATIRGAIYELLPLKYKNLWNITTVYGLVTVLVRDAVYCKSLIIDQYENDKSVELQYRLFRLFTGMFIDCTEKHRGDLIFIAYVSAFYILENLGTDYYYNILVSVDESLRGVFHMVPIWDTLYRGTELIQAAQLCGPAATAYIIEKYGKPSDFGEMEL